MRARVLVCAVNDGDEYVDLAAIADENVLDENPVWLGEQVEAAMESYGKSLVTYGFVDIEIPDDVIAKVIRQTASARVVKATAVEGES